jgi:hypothetical protein
VNYAGLWETVQDLGLILALHVGTDEPFTKKAARMGVGNASIDTKICAMQRGMADLIWGAIPQQYPRLRIVLVEGGIGWVASVLGSMDTGGPIIVTGWSPRSMSRRVFTSKGCSGLRSRMIGRSTHPAANRCRSPDYGVRLSAYRGHFPHSREQIAKDFEGIPEAETLRWWSAMLPARMV